MDRPPRGLPSYMRVLGLLAVGFAIGRVTAPAVAPPTAPVVTSRLAENPLDPEFTSAETPIEEDLSDDERARRQLIGVWTAQSHGTQVCTLNEDGTGSVKAELDWMAALVYGKKLDMSIQWHVEDGHLVQNLLGGAPAEMVDKLIRDFGAVKRYRIESLTDTTGVLIDTADGERTVWTSVP